MRGPTRIQKTFSCLVVGAVAAVMFAVTTPASTAASAVPSQRQWREDTWQAMTRSHRYLRHAIAAGDRRYAINLDIDNTSLASYYRKGAPVLAVRSFARYARRHGVAVLFNTGRVGRKVAVARKLLRKAGFPVTEMCGRSRLSEDLARGKRLCRAHFIHEGYTIVANVGNNRTDFMGPKNYGRAFHLPNYGGRLG